MLTCPTPPPLLQCAASKCRVTRMWYNKSDGYSILVMKEARKLIKTSFLINLLTMMRAASQAVSTSVGMPDNQTVVIMKITMNENSGNSSNSTEENLKENITSVFKLCFLNKEKQNIFLTDLIFRRCQTSWQDLPSCSRFWDQLGNFFKISC